MVGLWPAPALAATSRLAYPYAKAAVGTTDQWGFPVRICSSYVAWREARRGHPLLDPRWHGSAGLVWQFNTMDGAHGSLRPHVGDLMLWLPGQGYDVRWTGGSRVTMWTADEGGHVAYVTKVHRDHTVEVAEYNADTPYEFDTARVFSTHRFITWH